MASSPLVSLAVFCELHGPTPILVTQVQALPCFVCCCYNEHGDQEPPRKSSQESRDGDGLKNVTQITTALLKTNLEETPKEKPKSAVQEIQADGRRRDSSFRKTYNEDDKKQASPCGNCALTVPSHLKGKIPVGAPGSPNQNEGSPYLRTRRPVQRVPTPSDASPLSSSSSSSHTTDSDRSDTQIPPNSDSSSTLQQISFSNPNSDDKDTPTSNVHVHYLEYTSTHTPLTSSTYTLLRNCCLRTLSTETLPPATNNPIPTSPISNSISHSHSTSSGGPIFFGDPLAGYTTAYIFRIPDPFARGRIRRYALMALDTSGQRRAMRAFSFLASQFRELASWILGLAEREAERLEGGGGGNTNTNTTTSTDNSNSSSPGGGGIDSESQNGTTTTKSKPKGSLVSYPTPLSPLPIDTKFDGQRGIGESGRFKQTSSFLSGRQFDLDGGPYSRKGGYNVVRARGLAELVGMEDFFLELHRRFVVLLAQL